MKKKYIATKEEIEGIKQVISDILGLWNYDFISASNEHGHQTSMSKETFFKDLERDLS